MISESPCPGLGMAANGITTLPSPRFAVPWPSDSDDSTSSYESYPGQGIVSPGAHGALLRR
jgi:hypothetical protein